MAYQDGEALASGSLSAVATGVEIDHDSVHVDGTLSASANGKITKNIVVDMVGTLSSTTATIMYKDAYASLYGSLTGTLMNGSDSVFCPTLFVDMTIQMLNGFECKTIGEEKMDISLFQCETEDVSMNVERHRGDTYPVLATLGRNGNMNTAGITFKMSTQIGEEAIYTATGTVLDPLNGVVEFVLPSGAIDTAGSGVYDIQGEDTYVYTYIKGTFTLIDDVTP